MVYLLLIDFFFSFSNDWKDERLSLIASVCTYANIDLIRKVVFQICLNIANNRAHDVTSEDNFEMHDAKNIT